MRLFPLIVALLTVMNPGEYHNSAAARKLSVRKNISGDDSFRPPAHYLLERDLMSNYNRRLIPRRQQSDPITVYFSIGLYQIIEVNEPQEYMQLNSWIVERWKDDLLYWDPKDYEGLKEIVLPKDSVWVPDTTLYNSLVMNDEDSRRSLSVKLTSLPEQRSTLIEMLYPTLYKFSCTLDLRYFPFDLQRCVLTFGSWAHDNGEIDYFPHDEKSTATAGALSSGTQGMGVEHCIENEGWNILSTGVNRKEVKFECCPTKYTLLEYYLHIQRKPLYYLVNLIVPTSVITLIALIGFFSSSTVNDAREEKISLGITTLLSMSILIFLVADQMPSTSSFIPLIGWFYTAMLLLISAGTLASSFVIYIQKKGIVGERPSSKTMRWAKRLGLFILMEMPLLMKQAYIEKEREDKFLKQHQQQLLANAIQALEEHRRQKRHKKGKRRQSIAQLWHRINNVAFNAFSAPYRSPSGTPSRRLEASASTYTVDADGENAASKRRSGNGALQLKEFGSGFSNPLQRFKGKGGDGGGDGEDSLLASHGGMKLRLKMMEEDASSEGSEESEEEVLIMSSPPANSGRPVPSSQKPTKHFDNEGGGDRGVAGDHESDSRLPPRPLSPKVVRTMAPTKSILKSAAVRTSSQSIKSDSLPYLSRAGRPFPPPLYRHATSTSAKQQAGQAAAAVADRKVGGGENKKPPVPCPELQRNLAQIEYDWLAAVVERLFLLLFLLLFILMSFGINGIGMYYWSFTTLDVIKGS